MIRPQRPDAWFVRVRRRGSYNITPCTREGWLVTLAYCVISVGLTPVIIPPTTVRVAAWLILFLGATGLFIFTAWRTSSPAKDQE